MPRPRNPAPVYRLKPNRQGYLSVTWTEDGRSRSLSTGTKDRTQAERWLTQYLAGQSAPDARSESIGDLLDAYLEARKAKPSYGSMKAIANILRPAFGDLEPRHVNQALVNRFAEQRKREGRSNSTIVSDMIVLRSAVNWAIKQKIIGQEHKLTFEMPVQRSKPRDRWLTKEDAAKLLAECRAPHIRLFVLLGLKTGARRDAILTLKWKQVDLGRRRIDFGEDVGNKRRSVVPIDDRLHAELTATKELATTEFVIEYGGHPVRDIRRGLEAAAERAGLDHVHPHLLRHTAATWMVMGGVPTSEVARYLMMTEAMVERVYGKHSPEYLKRASQALDF